MVDWRVTPAKTKIKKERSVDVNLKQENVDPPQESDMKQSNLVANAFYHSSKGKGKLKKKKKIK